MVVAHAQAACAVLGEIAEMLPHPPYWFECLKAGGLPGGADADALGTEMVD